MRALILAFGFCSLTALAAGVPENAYFLIVGPTDAQLAACPSPVAIKKGAFKNGDFLKGVYPGEKIAVASSKGALYAFTAGARTVSIKVISDSEFQWDEKAGKDFSGKLCKKAMYSTNAANQEQLDSMIPDEEIEDQADEKEVAKDGAAAKRMGAKAAKGAAKAGKQKAKK